MGVDARGPMAYPGDMSKTLLIDSGRDVHASAVARDFSSAYDHIYRSKTEWDLVILDFDLNSTDEDGTQYTGRTLLMLMSDEPPAKMPRRFKLTTSNLSARADMEALLVGMGYERRGTEYVKVMK